MKMNKVIFWGLIIFSFIPGFFAWKEFIELHYLNAFILSIASYGSVILAAKFKLKS